MSDLKEIERIALGLNKGEKAALANKLLYSIEEVEEGNMEKEWKEEVERRVRELELGEARAIPSDQVFAEAEKRCKE